MTNDCFNIFSRGCTLSLLVGDTLNRLAGDSPSGLVAGTPNPLRVPATSPLGEWKDQISSGLSLSVPDLPTVSKIGKV